MILDWTADGPELELKSSYGRDRRSRNSKRVRKVAKVASCEAFRFRLAPGPGARARARTLKLKISGVSTVVHRPTDRRACKPIVYSVYLYTCIVQSV
jgi:hypothetical protein